MKKAAPREIGSEFWDIPISEKLNSLFPSDTAWYISGRSAEKAILADIKAKHSVKRAALPSWCCDSMITPFVEAGIEIVFYPVYMENGQLIRDVSCASECDILFVMDYFGYTGLESYNDYPGIVIRDVTHSIFSKMYTDADYYFGSLRKWAGFWTGGYAWGIESKLPATDVRYTAMRSFAMEAKAQYMAGMSESKDYLSDFNLAEEYLEHCPLAGADLRDIGMAHKIDVPFLKAQRRKNASRLLDVLSDMAIFPKLNSSDCPMFVPIMAPHGKRDKLRRYLIEHEIYCPVHWPLTQCHKPDKRTMEIFNNELSIVCDQRYDENDMERIIKAIREF